MIYGISDKPKSIKDYLLYGSQQTLSILTATILISTICGTNVSAGLVGAGMATIVFLVLTRFKAPLFFSNSGSTCAAVIAALSLCGDYTGVVIGGAVACAMNIIAAILCKKAGTGWVSKLLPPIVSGTIVLVIGLNLSFFCPTYAQVNGEYSLVGVLVALATMLITVITMHYAKGRLSTLPFLIGALGGYALCIIITLLGIAPLIDFNLFKEMTLFIKPDFAFYHLDFVNLNKAVIPTIVLTFAAVNLANIGEHISDVLAVSAVVDEDLTKTVGLDNTFLGDGVADLVGCIIGGQPTTTYSESLSTIAVSKVASTRVILVSAIMTILLGFFGPFNTLIVSMHNCIFAGISLVAYGCIAFAGIRTLHNVELNSKNMIIFAVMGTIGISGIALTFGAFTLSTIALSMIVGLALNLILK